MVSQLALRGFRPPPPPRSTATVVHRCFAVPWLATSSLESFADLDDVATCPLRFVGAARQPQRFLTPSDSSVLGQISRPGRWGVVAVWRSALVNARRYWSRICRAGKFTCAFSKPVLKSLVFRNLLTKVEPCKCFELMQTIMNKLQIV